MKHCNCIQDFTNGAITGSYDMCNNVKVSFQVFTAQVLERKGKILTDVCELRSKLTHSFIIFMDMKIE